MSDLLQWLNTNPQFAGLVTFVISAAESIAIIGTIVPGSITMTALGALAGAGVIPLWGTLSWAILGAIVGDGVSYWIGYYYKARLQFLWPFNRYPNLLLSGEKFFYKYGGMSVFIGRFVGPVRALVPLVAGMLGMRPFIFFVANITSAIGWAPAYMLPGIVLGAASQELPSNIAVHVILVLLLMTLLALLCLWFIYKSLQLIHNQTTYLQDTIWRRLQGSSFGTFVTKVLKHHNPLMTHGQLTLAIYFIVTCILFFSLAIYVSIVGPQSIGINESIFQLSRSLRYPSVDHVMICLTLLGQKQIILPAMMLLCAWLLYLRRYYAAIHVFALAFLAAISIAGLKILFHVPRPWGLASNVQSYSMPSGHTTLATAVYMSLAFFIASTISENKRKYIYYIAISITILVGISRIYLGAHWFTDVLSSWFLGAALTILIIISYERNSESAPPTLQLCFISFSSLFLAFGVYYYLEINKLTAFYQPLHWPIVNVNALDWWEKNEDLPTYQTNIFGFPSQKINIEWAGELVEIESTLNHEGWSKPPARDFISTLHRIADVSSTEYLPLIAPQYLDKSPTLTLSRHALGFKSLMVIRLWRTNRMVQPMEIPLWVGIIGTIPRPYGWIFKKYLGDVDLSPSLIFPLHKGSNQWQWKIVTTTVKKGSPNIQHIIYIRPRHKK